MSRNGREERQERQEMEEPEPAEREVQLSERGGELPPPRRRSSVRVTSPAQELVGVGSRPVHPSFLRNLNAIGERHARAQGLPMAHCNLGPCKRRSLTPSEWEGGREWAGAEEA